MKIFIGHLNIMKIWRIFAFSTNLKITIFDIRDRNIDVDWISRQIRVSGVEIYISTKFQISSINIRRDNCFHLF